METTRVSSKGQVVLPRAVRERKRWQPGTTLVVEETREGVLLRPEKPFPPATFEEVIGILQYKGKPVTLEEMDEAIAEEVKARHARGRY
jgi:AbrB family looped-hinge helix DNA binding protein